MKQLIVVVLLAVISGCGGIAPATNVVVIGNSLTLVHPNASLGWSGNWGMAASAQNKDFAHLVAAGFNLPVSVTNFSQLEEDPAVGAPMVSAVASVVTPQSIVIVELSDNVPDADLNVFRGNYASLLQRVRFGKKLTCTGPYWPDAAKKTLVQSECLAHGGIFVSLDDIRYDPNNPDYAPGAPSFSDPAVNGHPHDWSMARIAQRILGALQP